MRSRRAGVFTTLVVVAYAAAPRPAAACPAFLEAQQLGPTLAGARRDVRLFTLEVDGKARRWQSQPVQVDPMEKGMGGGVLIVPEDGRDLDRDPLAPLDRIALQVETFGAPRADKDPAPCRTGRLFELQNPAEPARFAYLAVCDDAAGATRSRVPNPVALLTDVQQIKSPLFDYTYLANNQLLFSKLAVHDPKSGQVLNAGEAADILLHLDVKNFFTINLTNSNVQSFVEHTRSGSLGLVERLQFFLKILAFKIDLKMATTASFFADSANLPMLMDIPLEPSERLHPGSGMLFNWLPKAARILPQAKGSTAVPANPKWIAEGTAALAREGLKSCRATGQGMCTYTMEGVIGQPPVARPFFIDMVVPRYLVEKGFFPMFVADLAKFKAAAAWDADDDADQNRVAMYFEVSGIPQGQHKMDYWIRLGDGPGKAATCPTPVNVRGPVGIPSVPAVAR